MKKRRRIRGANNDRYARSGPGVLHKSQTPWGPPKPSNDTPCHSSGPPQPICTHRNLLIHMALRVTYGA